MNHSGLWCSFVSRIGGQAGLNALYWKRGVCLYEKATRSRALIEQETLENGQGKIRIRTQKGQAAALLVQLCKILGREQERWGIQSSSPPLETQHHPAETSLSEIESLEKVQSKLEFMQESVSEPEYYISYAWKDSSPEGKDREAIVDRLCDAAVKNHNIKVIRDKDNIGLGESISKFMIRIGQANRVFVVLSDKYLKSPYCMFELFEIWRNSRLDEDEFSQRIRTYCHVLIYIRCRADFGMLRSGKMKRKNLMI